MHSIFRLVPLARLSGLLILAACGRDGGARPDADPAPSFAALFDSIGSLSLEENQATINVAPAVTPDTDGGFIVVDAKELQGRLYDRTGRLVAAFGRDGEGPGEFTAPMVGRRMASGDLLVADAMESRITFFDPTGARAVGTARVPLLPLYDALPRPDSMLLLVGRPSGGFHAPLLHLWDRRTGRIERSFFPTPGDETVQKVAASVGWADAALRGDTIAVAFAMADTLYLFAFDGRLRERIPLPFRSFALPGMPSPRERGDPRARNRWLETLTRISDVFWLPDGSFLVQYARRKGAENEWGLLHVTRDGRRIFELPAAPRLVTARGDTLFFVDPRAEVPSQWRIARLRAGA